MIFITGDTHGEFSRVGLLSSRMETTKDDVLIILGDAGINFSGPGRDRKKKEYLAELPITVFALQGNHDMRPERVGTYREVLWHGGTVFTEDRYPNILFAKDGEIYDIGGKKTVVIGGAYSVDKFFRLRHGWPWFEDEQPSEEIRARAETRLAQEGWKVDMVLTHTCPRKYEPVEVFAPGMDQSKVDKSTEDWLDTVEERLDYGEWYCGHFHIEKDVGRLRFLYKDIVVYNSSESGQYVRP